MSRVLAAAGVAAVLTVGWPAGVGATHGEVCRSAVGTFVVVPLPGAAVEGRLSVYVHERPGAEKPVWVYLESGLAAGYNPGGARADVDGVRDVVVVNDVDCYDGGHPDPVADTLIL